MNEIENKITIITLFTRAGGGRREEERTDDSRKETYAKLGEK